MKTYSKQFYAIFRILVGLLFLQHGLQKMFGAFGGLGGNSAEIFSMMGVAGIIETVGGVLIALGLLTTIAASISALLMLSAYFIAHIGNGLFPILNGGELALLYLASFLVIASQGSGIWSIDSLRNKHKEHHS